RMMLPRVVTLRRACLLSGFAIGAVMVALGLAGPGGQGRGTLPVSAQAVYDRGLALGLLLVGALFGAVGDHWSLVLFGGAGLAALFVTVTTRYSAGGPV